MRLIIVPILVCIIVAAAFGSSPTVLCKDNTKTSLPCENKKPYDAPTEKEYPESKESPEEEKISDNEEEFISNQTVLRLKCPSIFVLFFPSNFFLSSDFASILSPPPKI